MVQGFSSTLPFFALSNASPSTVFDRPHFLLVFELLRELLLVPIPIFRTYFSLNFAFFPGYMLFGAMLWRIFFARSCR